MKDTNKKLKKIKSEKMSAICGKMCLKAIVIDEAMKCSQCKVMFHPECLLLQKQLCTSIIKWKTPNVQFRCDKCVQNDNGLQALLERVTSEFAKMDKKNNDQHAKMMEKIEKIERSMSKSGQKVVEEIVKVVEEKKSDVESGWSNVVRGNKNNKKKRESVVIITPKDKEQDRKITKTSLKNAIDPADFTFSGMRNATNNGLIISCENDDDCLKLINEAEQKLGEKYEIRKPAKRLPRFKILRVKDSDEDDATLIADLKRQNRCVYDDKFKFEVIKREQVKIKGKNIDGMFNIVLQTNGETFKKVMDNGNLNVNWQNCKVVDNVYIRRCYKCYGFNHESKNCTAEVACSTCSLPHLKKDCKSKNEKCINCVTTNKRLSLNMNVNHNVWSNECPVYLRKLEMSKRAISYID